MERLLSSEPSRGRSNINSRIATHNVCVSAFKATDINSLLNSPRPINEQTSEARSSINRPNSVSDNDPDTVLLKVMSDFLIKQSARYLDKYGLNIQIISNSDPSITTINIETINKTIKIGETIGIVIHDSHCSPILIHKGKALILDRMFSKTFDLDCPKYFLAGEFTPQTDFISCAIFAIKHLKMLLKNKQQLLQKSLYDENQKEFYLHPLIFKYSQSNKNLYDYIALYQQKYLELNGHENKDIDLDELEAYRKKKSCQTIGHNRMNYLRQKYYQLQKKHPEYYTTRLPRDRDVDKDKDKDVDVDSWLSNLII